MWHALVDGRVSQRYTPSSQAATQASVWLSDSAATVDFATLQHCEWQVVLCSVLSTLQPAQRSLTQVGRVNCAWKLAAVADSCPGAARWDVGLLQSISLNCGSYEHGILIISPDWLLSRHAVDALALLARLQLVGVRECFSFFFLFFDS